MPSSKRTSLVDEALQQIWGYDSFRPHQAESIQSIMAGTDSLTVLPTGGGKSLCYQLPGAVMNGTAIVVSPLIALMADQVNALQMLGIPAAFLNSSLSADQVRKTKASMFRGELKLLYVSPERLLLEHFREELAQISISFFAIDEAHCISQWGHDFRPEYTQLGLLRELFPQTGIHAFTATAPPAVRDEIMGQLRLEQPHIQIGDYFRKNLFYRSLPRDKVRTQLLSILGKYNRADNGIIYCLTRKETERIADTLNREGYRVLPYHAGLSHELRQNHQEQFAQEMVHIMVATIAFGMGIDQSNIRFVIHLGLPRSLSHYQQESGRAGRDGLPADCVLLHGPRDILFWKRINEEEPSLAPQRTVHLQDMIQYAGQIRCRHRALVEYFGQEFTPKSCGACDVCAGEIEGISDARKISRIILSGVLKTRQQFGGAYVAQVLTGSRDKKILNNGDDRHSIYGMLSKHAQSQVHDWINQLEGQNYLARSEGPYPVIGVTQNGYWLLRPDKFEKSEEELPVVLVATRKKATAPSKSKWTDGPFDLQLFEHLRSVRARLAAKNGVPAFIVFGDRSLQDMARRRPTDDEAFLQVFGVGRAKLEKFGAAMMAAIRTFEEE